MARTTHAAEVEPTGSVGRSLRSTSARAGGSERFAEDAAAVREMYEHLDALGAVAGAQLAAVLRSSTVQSPQAQVEREAHVARLNRRLAQLRAAERRLVFGRLDLNDGNTLYVGRLGLRPDGRVLVDWRAPAAAAFYQATAARPGPAVRRRHLHLEDRRLVDVNEEILALHDGPNPQAGDETDHQDGGDQRDAHHNGHQDGHRFGADGSADLLTKVLSAPRTGRMRDIVNTLQSEQDRVIRTPGRGALVVDGAPGTGKTVVALHRAAYLLYTEPARRAGGVLVVGPNAAFLRYIEQVLPALGETDVVLAEAVDLYPLDQLTVDDEADPAVARLKGEIRMVEVLRRAISERQRLLVNPVTLTVDDVEIVLRPEVVRRARSAARESGDPHNKARDTYAEIVLEDLLQQFLTTTSGAEDPDQEQGPDAADNSTDGPRDSDADGASSRAQALAALRGSVHVRREVNLRWMPLTPEKVLEDLFADEDRLAAATLGWSAADRARLARRRGDAWTRDDVALLDELAALLGPLPQTAAQQSAEVAQEAARREAVRFAMDTLTSYGIGASLNAEEVARRYGVDDHLADHRPLAERAAADPSWAYGHVVVDEAQDLTPMQWRMVLRRCPSRSMTIVGDLNQRSGTTAAAGTSSRPQTWADVLGPCLPSWRQETLTVNYRTPGEHLELARGRLRDVGVDVHELESARWGGTLGDIDVADAGLPTLIAEELDTCQGTLAVVTADPGHISDLLAPNVERDVSVITPRQAKGLEFDTVIVLDPADIAARLGPGDLYVSLTRATQRLVLARRTAPRGGDYCS